MTVFSCPMCNHVLRVEPIGDFLRSAGPNVVSDVAETSLRAKMAILKRRCTQGTGRVWDLVKAVATRHKPCTIGELSHDLQVPKETILSWRRILGRCCHPKRLNLKVIERSGENYLMNEETRKIVTELG